MSDEDEPESFATVEQLESGWHALTESERTRAEELLADVSDHIRIVSPIWQRLQQEHPRTLKRITCDVVRRIMLSDDSMPGVTQRTDTTGPFTNSLTFANPTGDLYLRDSEKRILGVGGQRAFSIDMATGKVG